MALEHAILVALRERPGSGYELTRRFDRSIGFFWTATHQQIYRVLRRMEELGWVRADVVPQPGRPDKKVYEVTAGGVGELRRWLAEPTDPEPVRLDLGVKVRAAATSDAAAVLDELRRQRDRHARRLETYRQIEKRDFTAAETATRRQRVQHLVLRGGIAIEQSWLDWCDDAIGVLSDLEHGR